jgi:hypothetical protein
MHVFVKLALPALSLFLQLAAQPRVSDCDLHAGSLCSSATFEYLLPTATVSIQSCSSTNFLNLGSDASHCSESSANSAFAVASIVACPDVSDFDLSTSAIPAQFSAANMEDSERNSGARCQVSSCACADEDDDDCVDCLSSRATDFPCSTHAIELNGHSSCLRLTSRIPLSFTSWPTSGYHSPSSNRFVFKLWSPNSSSSSEVSRSPALGPWSFGHLHRWTLVQSNPDDVLSALGLSYRLVTLGSDWPDARCLDGSKGAYYM